MLSTQDPENVELLRRNAKGLKVYFVVVFNPAGSKNQVDGRFVVSVPELGCLDFFFDFHPFKSHKKIVHGLSWSSPKAMDYSKGTSIAIRP